MHFAQMWRNGREDNYHAVSIRTKHRSRPPVVGQSKVDRWVLISLRDRMGCHGMKAVLRFCDALNLDKENPPVLKTKSINRKND
jgi:hypothetical protein